MNHIIDNELALALMPVPLDETTDEESRAARIVAAATRLLEMGGRDAMSTRAVSAEAGVQAPTIYRLFGDKQGLLDAVATAGFTRYLAHKTDAAPIDDPIEDLCAGWDLHVELGLASPALYSLMYDDRRPSTSPAARAAIGVLATRIHRIAAAGRLRVSERHAVDLVHAAGHGTTLTLLATPEHERDLELSALARDAVIAAITTTPGGRVIEHPSSGLLAAAITLRARLPDADELSGPERALMQEWLDRIADRPH